VVCMRTCWLFVSLMHRLEGFCWFHLFRSFSYPSREHRLFRFNHYATTAFSNTNLNFSLWSL
jgi:hypothetical protein